MIKARMLALNLSPAVIQICLIMLRKCKLLNKVMRYPLIVDRTQQPLSFLRWLSNSSKNRRMRPWQVAECNKGKRSIKVRSILLTWELLRVQVKRIQWYQWLRKQPETQWRNANAKSIKCRPARAIIWLLSRNLIWSIVTKASLI